MLIRHVRKGVAAGVAMAMLAGCAPGPGFRPVASPSMTDPVVTADATLDGAACTAYRRAYVARFTMAVQSLAADGGVRELPVDQTARERCRLPTCYIEPHDGGFDPRCGWWVPNSGDGGLYVWQEWRADFVPPGDDVFDRARQREVEAARRVRRCGDQHGTLC